MKGKGFEVRQTWFKSLPSRHLATGCPLWPHALLCKMEVILAPILLIWGAQKKHK